MNWDQCIADQNLILSRNYSAGRSGRKIEFIGIHYEAGNLSLQTVYNVWQTREASAHYAVESGGRIGQFVNDWDTAWALGDWDANCRSINIEHANQGDTITEACRENGAHLVAALCRLYGLGRPQWGVNVFPHKHFSATSCPGPLFGKYKDSYIKRCQEWYDAMMRGTQAPKPTPQHEQVTRPSSPAQVGIRPVNVTYCLRRLNGSWWPDVVNFNNSDDNGYAGAPHAQHDLLVAKVDRGRLKYQTMNPDGSWNDWVDRFDKNDTVHGCAGIPGVPICGVRFYYETPGGEPYQQAWYRSQTTKRAGYLAVCCDDGNSWPGFDGWAGIKGEPLDRLQLKIAASNPF